MSVLEKVDCRTHRNLVSDGFDTASASRESHDACRFIPCFCFKLQRNVIISLYVNDWQDLIDVRTSQLDNVG